MLPMLLNQLTVTSARVTTPAKGVWIADLDLDLDITGTLPTGRAVFTVGTKLLLGTIDEKSSGKFGEKARVILVGGGGGWGTIVPAVHLHNDAGVLSTAIFSVTAASVGEVVVDAIPKRLGTDFVRSQGPASRVLAGVDWYVNEAGITIVGPRLPIPFNPLDVDILEWEPAQKLATLASDELVMPGTVLLDLRFGTATVRDVEQTFGPEGARVKAWCDTSDLPITLPGTPPEVAGTRLVRALGALGREVTGVNHLRRYRYTVVLQTPDNKLTLQSLDIAIPVPLILQQIEVWPGVAGVKLKIAPGTECTVAFVNGDPAQPMVVGFGPTTLPQIEIALNALRVAIGAGLLPVVVGSPAFLTWVAAVTTAINTLAPGSAVAPLPLVSTKLFTD